MVPLRLESTRLPQKVLKKIGKMSLAEMTVSSALRAVANRKDVCVIAAVDDKETSKVLQSLEDRVEIIATAPSLPSGTDRVAEAARIFFKKYPPLRSQVKGIVNLQGDTPFAGARGLMAVVNYFCESTESQLKTSPFVTLSEEWPLKIAVNDLSKVKVICNRAREAIYFSRYPIPYSRTKVSDVLKKTKKQNTEPTLAMEMHIGVYGYTPQALARFVSSAPTELEVLEGLEQLRALWLGIPILVFKTFADSGESFAGIDTAKDLLWARNFQKRKKK